MVSINLTNGDDVLNATIDFPVVIDAMAGDDTINLVQLVESYDDTRVYGGAGRDFITIGTVEEYRYAGYADGGAGDDIVTAYYAFGGDGSDIVIGNDSPDGGAGDDIVEGGNAYGGSGSDEVFAEDAYGGDGNDLIHASTVASGGAGRDVFFALEERYSLGNVDLSDFTIGEDKLALLSDYHIVDHFSGTPNEIVYDAATGETGVDVFGDGIPQFTLAGKPEDIFIALAFQGTDASETASGSGLLVGEGGDDVLTGSVRADMLFGGFGNDVLSGGSGDDLLVGNANDDRLYGGAGNDELDGGDGNDTISGSTGDDFAYGGAGDDVIAGGGGSDRLLGESGDDRISGGADGDTLTGGAGNDILRGDAGNDTISGDDGNDVIYGGLGKDDMTGGSGADRFAFGAGDSKAGGSLRDLITDFTSGEDKLDLRALHMTDASLISFKAVGSGLIVYADTNDNGFDYSDFAVQLTGVSAVQANDFILV